MMSMRNLILFCLVFLSQTGLPTVSAFSSVVAVPSSRAVLRSLSHLSVTSDSSATATSEDAKNRDNNEIVAKRLVVTGDVQGGYVRACILNEAGKFRRLVGTMTDPDTTSDRAEIYVEGKRKMVDGFVRWCNRGKVGLSQTLRVVEIFDEEPTGLYESFYCKTKK